MPFIKARELARFYKADPAKTVQQLRESLLKGEVKPDEFSVRDLAETFVPDGREWLRCLNPADNGSYSVMEAAGAVDTADFANITGQIVYSAVMEQYENPGFVWPQLCKTIPTKLDGEKIPGVGAIGDMAETIDPGQPYPLAGIAEDWIETPSTTKRGFIVPVTKEAIFFDRTNLVLKTARDVGKWLGANKEKRVIDQALGVTNDYKWKGTAYSTYVSTPWDNTVSSNALADWTDINNVLLQFSAMTDPATAEPLLVVPKVLLCYTSLTATARYILNATQILWDSNANAATAKHMTYFDNPVRGAYQIISSPWIDARYTAGSVTSTTWFMGDFQSAFAYMENWPITVTQAANNSDDEFNRDIVFKFKASERGTVAVLDPRYVCSSAA